MMSELLRVEGLHIAVEGKEILKGLDLTINTGETHVIMGSNGAGKSTLFNAIMGNPKYVVTAGKIFFEGQEITEAPVNERAKAGIFMAFQQPIAVQGISVENFVRNAKSTISGQQRIMPFRKKLHAQMDQLKMDKSYAERYVNDGFSGGERKKTEILQMCMLEPKLTMLDEIDSGLDVDAVRVVSENGISVPQRKQFHHGHYSPQRNPAEAQTGFRSHPDRRQDRQDRRRIPHPGD